MKERATSKKSLLVPRVLPRGRHKLDREVVAASQRQRLLEAMAELVAEHGYAAVTIGDIATRAGTAKRTFYDHFADKEQCFLAALDGITDTLVQATARFFAMPGTVRERCEYSLRAYLELLGSMPSASKIFYLEAMATGPEAIDRRTEMLLRFAHNIVALSREAEAQGDGREISEQHALAVVGALHTLIFHQVHGNGPESLLDIIDEVVPLAVAFLTARVPAARAIEPGDARKRKRAGSAASRE
ncbi:MAG TPA: helix-turn-helix domain-containing protein [Kofleriaceae bacterium]|nr:helix-turn-helix domain-containing protein [Kofleriaceae bacterium]